ncbi:MAG TPA: chorismate synthase [Clostridiales bacterium]|nr:chorismate synthase [Clostridiales bacterium]
MKLTTAGESHGKALIGIIEGLPSNLKIDIDEINRYLALRQSGYGRGGRQKIERNCVEIISGVRNFLTLGSPLAFAVANADYKNWQGIMSPEGCDTALRTLTKVRPGHADLTGMIKYDQTDARNVLERASARETAARVAAGTIARQYLSELGVKISGYVKSVCGVADGAEYAFEQLEEAKKQPLFMLDENVQKQAIEKIDALKAEGDTAGGVIEIRIKGLKSGFGSCMQYSTKLDAALCAAMMSVQAIKGVEVGAGFVAADLPGSRVHDEIFYDGNRFFRKTNNAGGIEGGMSNGEEIVLRAAMKPIPTLMKGLKTVDYSTKQPAVAAAERSDVSAVCAAEIVLESAAAFALAEVVSARLGGDNMREVRERYRDLKA